MADKLTAKKAAPKQAKQPEPAKRKTGRPSGYTPEIGEAICGRLAAKESLRSICLDPDMPGMTTVFKWLADFQDFAKQYAHAREMQAEQFAEEIIQIADEQQTTVRGGEDGDTAVEVVFDATAVARNRLRVDARKWYASKVAPKKYGDKLAVGGADDLPPIKHAVDLKNLSPAELAQLEELTAKAMQGAAVS